MATNTSKKRGKEVFVTSYTDNKDGTTTYTTSDGTSDVGTYSRNSDGSLTFTPQETVANKNIIPQNTGVNTNGSQAMYGGGLANPGQTIQPQTVAFGTNADLLLKPKIATTSNPVITRSAPAQTPLTPPVTGVENWGDNQIKDYVSRAELNADKLTQDDLFKLKRSQQVLADRAYQQQAVNPYTEQIAAQEKARQEAETKLQAQNAQLMEAKKRELELMYGKRITGEQKAGERTRDIAQSALSFSGFGRSTAAAEQQTRIQETVNENINILNAERDAANIRYEAELQGATAEQLAGYDDMIMQLKQKSADFSVGLAKQMNEYNMQNAANYQEKIDNILQLAQSMQTVELTPGQMEKANAYATLLLDDEGNINEKMLADIPPTMKGYALKKAAELKVNMPKAGAEFGFINAGGGLIARTNPVTGEIEYSQGPVTQPEWSYNDKTGQYERTNTQGALETQVPFTGATGDLRSLASQFPGQARAKNNNPAGITWNSNFDNGKGTAALLDAAGIRYERGTPRPEGGNYVTFPTIEEGLEAQKIIMTQTYGNSTVQEMLGKWVGTGEALNYAKQVAGMAGIPLNVQVNQLNDQQVSVLQMAKIQKESPGLAKLLQQSEGMQGGYDPNKAPQYTSYIENGKLPTGMKSGSKEAEAFIAQAGEGYIDAKNKEYQQKGFTIGNPEAFKNIDQETLKAVNKAVSQVPAFETAMNNLIADVEKYGTELPITAKGRSMQQQVKNIQLVAKEIYNLGVLNGPDLSLMESIIANPATWTSKLSGAVPGVNYKDLLKKGKETILNNAYAQARNIGLEPIDNSTPITTVTPAKKQAADDLWNKL